MVATISAGGASSAAQWAVHAPCDRFRGTDPMITGRTRRALAAHLQHPDTSAGIPDARWMRAMVFERLCHDPAFAGEVATRATGWSGFPRPTAVVRVDCGVSPSATSAHLAAAAERALDGTATLISKLAIPYPGFADGAATNVLPDLAVVARGPLGPTVVVGDVKDYERVRSRIDDGRLLKGFLQVAMGAFALQRWNGLPNGLAVSGHGFLAVPRSAFLQPTVEVEDLRDHLAEVETQWRSRLDAITAEPLLTSLPTYVAHLRAAFDPGGCRSCSLFNHCRHELRSSTAADALLVEIGVPENERPSVLPMLAGGEPLATARPSTVSRLRATLTGRVATTGQRRVDSVGRPGVVNVVAVKSDAAALGFHGVGVSRETADGPTAWKFHVFEDPQADSTRRRVMAVIGKELELAMAQNAKANPARPEPVHLVVPDAATADLLASAADHLAGVELSRLRWKRDLEMGRPLLTYNGEQATMPAALEGARRTAVSFLLEHDRARMLTVRHPVIDLTTVMARHFEPGGPTFDASRLDYVVAWAGAGDALDHRVLSDEVEARAHTPGARLANATSNAINEALRALRRTGQLDAYETLVGEELAFKAQTLDDAVEALDALPDSKLQPAYRSLEGDAQAVWRRRMRLRASDLVRFGRTYPFWRNLLVDVIQSDDLCATQLAVLANPERAAEKATDAGDRDLFWATVVFTAPLTIDVASRRVGPGDRVVLLAHRGSSWLETDGVAVRPQGTAIKLLGYCLGPLEAPADPAVGAVRGRFQWAPHLIPPVATGDRVVLARLDWFQALARKSEFNVGRPRQDEQASPKASCDESSYASDSEGHRWCCRPHELVEAEFSDEIALRRARRELNPEVWPPVRDLDGFEVAPTGKPTSQTVDVPDAVAPEGVTLDDLD